MSEKKRLSIVFLKRYRPKQGEYRAECIEAKIGDYATAAGTSLEMSDSRAMMQDGELQKRFKTRRFHDGKILAPNDLYREF